MATSAGVKRGPNRAREVPAQPAEPAALKYIYAVVPDTEGRSYDFVGLDDCPVYAISDGRAAFVVSEISRQRIRPERRHLAAHRAVLDRLVARERAVLPIRFGTIARGSGAVRAMLARQRERFAHELQRVSGKVEMGLRVVWDVPNIFDYFVNTHPELRAGRDRLFGTYSQPSHEAKIELGRMFERLLDDDRARHAERVEAALAPCCAEIRRNPPRSEREVMNLACLIAQSGQEEFETGVLQAAAAFDNNFSFDFNGPWAPHGFVEMTLEP